MSLNRRLQILLDEQRYQRIAAEAAARGVSVARVIRDAIDRGLGQTEDRRTEALRQVMAAAPMDVPADPAELSAELDDVRAGRFS